MTTRTPKAYHATMSSAIRNTHQQNNAQQNNHNTRHTSNLIRMQMKEQQEINQILFELSDLKQISPDRQHILLKCGNSARYLRRNEWELTIKTDIYRDYNRIVKKYCLHLQQKDEDDDYTVLNVKRDAKTKYLLIKLRLYKMDADFVIKVIKGTSRLFELLSHWFISQRALSMKREDGVIPMTIYPRLINLYPYLFCDYNEDDHNDVFDTCSYLLICSITKTDIDDGLLCEKGQILRDLWSKFSDLFCVAAENMMEEKGFSSTPEHQFLNDRNERVDFPVTSSNTVTPSPDFLPINQKTVAQKQEDLTNNVPSYQNEADHGVKETSVDDSSSSSSNDESYDEELEEKIEIKSKRTIIKPSLNLDPTSRMPAQPKPMNLIEEEAYNDGESEDDTIEKTEVGETDSYAKKRNSETLSSASEEEVQKSQHDDSPIEHELLINAAANSNKDPDCEEVEESVASNSADSEENVVELEKEEKIDKTQDKIDTTPTDKEKVVPPDENKTIPKIENEDIRNTDNTLDDVTEDVSPQNDSTSMKQIPSYRETVEVHLEADKPLKIEEEEIKRKKQKVATKKEETPDTRSAISSIDISSNVIDDEKSISKESNLKNFEKESTSTSKNVSDICIEVESSSNNKRQLEVSRRSIRTPTNTNKAELQSEKSVPSIRKRSNKRTQAALVEDTKSRNNSYHRGTKLIKRSSNVSNDHGLKNTTREISKELKEKSIFLHPGLAALSPSQKYYNSLCKIGKKSAIFANDKGKGRNRLDLEVDLVVDNMSKRSKRRKKKPRRTIYEEIGMPYQILFHSNEIVNLGQHNKYLKAKQKKRQNSKVKRSCCCGTEHDENDDEAFYIKCDECTMWFFVNASCIGFDEYDAEKEIASWECWYCFDREENVVEQIFPGFYIQCDECKVWFNLERTGFKHKEACRVRHWSCGRCVNGKQIFISKKRLEQPIESLTEKPGKGKAKRKVTKTLETKTVNKGGLTHETCVCGKRHNKKIEVSSMQCTSCSDWYNVAKKCIGLHPTDSFDDILNWQCTKCLQEIADGNYNCVCGAIHQGREGRISCIQCSHCEKWYNVLKKCLNLGDDINVADIGYWECNECKKSENVLETCICGKKHHSKFDPFYLQCDTCNIWYNVIEKCVKFDGETAPEFWQCNHCRQKCQEEIKLAVREDDSSSFKILKRKQPVEIENGNKRRKTAVDIEGSKIPKSVKSTESNDLSSDFRRRILPAIYFSDIQSILHQEDSLLNTSTKEAITIQTVFRGYCVRKQLNRERKIFRLHTASVTLQKFFSKIFSKIQKETVATNDSLLGISAEDKKKVLSIICIQRWALRIQREKKTDISKREKSVKILQAFFRKTHSQFVSAMVIQKYYITYINEKQMKKAVTQIQSLYRARNAKRSFFKLKRQRDWKLRWNAIIKIQNLGRNYLNKVKYDKQLHNHSARKIQRRVRLSLNMKKNNPKKLQRQKSAILLQRLWHRYLKNKYRCIKAAVLFQSLFRRHLAKKNYILRQSEQEGKKVS